MRAEDIANKVYDILHDLGKQIQTFTYISRYDPLYLLGGDSNTVFVDIFYLLGKGFRIMLSPTSFYISYVMSCRLILSWIAKSL